MTAINSMQMVWDFEDQLQQVDLGGGGTAYYVYDAGGPARAQGDRDAERHAPEGAHLPRRLRDLPRVRRQRRRP